MFIKSCCRWRRRWFILRQGEIPGQFHLEYYTDRNCRKLKGMIDLDQCEQVDSGLRLEHRKQKFQNMFDVKTPRRTYYLAADSEADMNDWVACICQVCNLQDLSNKGTNSDTNRQYYNVGSEAQQNKPTDQRALILSQPSLSNSANQNDQPTSSANKTDTLSKSNSMYSNRETMLCDAQLSKLSATSSNQSNDSVNYYNFAAIENEITRIQAVERSQSVRIPNEQPNGIISHTRAQSLVEIKPSSGTIRKIPENLKLSENFILDNSEPSPALSTSSGPYIPISECFSGSPGMFDNPLTPLNSLDPKFYDTPRSHINIGLNLINDQPYSPKRNNCPPSQPRPRSERSSPTDSESVFTDDEDWTHQSPQRPLDRSLRPSDSSVENDSIVITYAQRFSKLPTDEKTSENGHGLEKRRKSVPSRPPKRISGLQLEGVEERNKEIHSSDTENASPAIGPKDISCCVEDSYDIPRSHQMPYYNLNESNSNSPTSVDRNSITSSTPNLSSDVGTMKLPKRSHFYSNAAPSKVDGNFFRYDFVEQVRAFLKSVETQRGVTRENWFQENAPVVDRGLKPKALEIKSKDCKEQPDILQSTKRISTSSFHLESRPPPPCDRKLKPGTPKYDTNSLRRKGYPMTENALYSNQSEALSKTLPRNYNNSSASSTLTLTRPMASQQQPPAAKPVGHLEYFDLDHSNAPPICNINNSKLNSTSSSNLSIPHRTNPPFAKAPQPDSSGIVYKSVDFVKTQAIALTRQDTEKNRNEKKTSNKD
ncbi:Protein daughter of sevenless [Pseudolycoriella hygida]|uniref:Protein daughter of sevenless n=1 Tax=Pseudolycoriella hygida TaxID=35572 RepID=A0A9Q0N4H6_9DIPT|nr:Protein daughter of sevenless [Pseudolycoriella hygida]